ncbi:trimethylamine methyltransferase family protein [Actinomycetota bacterium]
MKLNFSANQTVHFKILSKSQIEEIVSTAFEILYRVGVEVNDEETLDLLNGAGCIIKGKKVFIPNSLVKECLSYTPSKISVSDRNGKLAMELEKDKPYFGTGSECPYMLDPFNGNRRQWLYEDIENAAKISDYLQNIDFHMSLGLLSGVNNMTYDRYQLVAMLKNTEKPIVSTAIDVNGLKDMFNVCSILTDGEDNFKLRPNFVLYIETISPLIHSREVLEKIKFAADKSIPTIYTNAVNAGATGPVTLAGTIALGAAEYLSGVVIAQLIKKGAPIIGGGTLFAMDMSTGVASYGSTENYLMDAAMTEVCQYLGLPVFSLCGCSSSKVFDGQATMEAMYSTMTAALSGANLIHDIGYLEDGLCGSFEQLVVTDEIIGMVKRFISGIKVDKNTLALDIIEKIGPGGNFLSEDHTFKNFKNEMFMPELIDRSVFANWKKAGSKTLETRVNEKVKEILSTYQPEPIEDNKMAQIEEYMKKNVE